MAGYVELPGGSGGPAGPGGPGAAASARTRRRGDGRLARSGSSCPTTTWSWHLRCRLPRPRTYLGPLRAQCGRAASPWPASRHAGQAGQLLDALRRWSTRPWWPPAGRAARRGRRLLCRRPRRTPVVAGVVTSAASPETPVVARVVGAGRLAGPGGRSRSRWYVFSIGVPGCGPAPAHGAPLRHEPPGAARGRRPDRAQRPARAVRWLLPGLGLPGARHPADVARFRDAVRSETDPDAWFAAQVHAPLLIVPHSNKDAYLDRYAQAGQGLHRPVGRLVARRPTGTSTPAWRR